MIDGGLTTRPGAAARAARVRRLADERGIVAGIAIDHRDSLRAALARRGIGPLDTAALRRLKLELARALAPEATAIMLDEELGGLALDEGVVPADTGLIMPLEAQTPDDGEDLRTELMTAFTPVEAAARGADACKVLVPYRADRPETAGRQDAVIREAVAACHALDLPLVVEPVVPRLAGEPAAAHAAAYPELVIEAAARIAALGVDLLKLPFPVVDLAATGERAAAATCRRMAAACGLTPWVLLGGFVDIAAFLEQIRLAGDAGAAGFLVGRAVWGAALDADPATVARLAAGAARDDLRRCREAAGRFARPLPSPAER